MIVDNEIQEVLGYKELIPAATRFTVKQQGDAGGLCCRPFTHGVVSYVMQLSSSCTWFKAVVTRVGKKGKERLEEVTYTIPTYKSLMPYITGHNNLEQYFLVDVETCETPKNMLEEEHIYHLAWLKAKLRMISSLGNKYKKNKLPLLNKVSPEFKAAENNLRLLIRNKFNNLELEEDSIITLRMETTILVRYLEISIANLVFMHEKDLWVGRQSILEMANGRIPNSKANKKLKATTNIEIQNCKDRINTIYNILEQRGL